MENLPGPLREVVARFASLPGVGPKSALRMAMHILGLPRERADAFGRSILELRENLVLCSRCGALAEADPCPLCADPVRDHTRLCLVGEWDSLLVLEQAGLFKGCYMVLGGLISPLDGGDPARLGFDRLRARLGEGEVAEVILALGATVEAETTASYVRNLVAAEFPSVLVSRLAQGIPIGGEVKYMDKETLRQSLLHRQKV